jgi:hypothetical protein
MQKMNTYELSKEQNEKFENWRKDKGDLIELVGAVGGAYSFCFTPTGIGVLVKVTCADGTELDLTEWEYF